MSNDIPRHGKKINLTNLGFIKGVFGGNYPRAHVTGFTEDPTTLDTSGLRHYWGGGPWDFSSHLVGPGRNSFFTISVFNQDPVSGRAKRRKVLFDRCHCIVFDDANLRSVDWKDTSAKVPADKISLEPSWTLETSPFNYQVGYIIKDGDPRGGKVSALLDALVDSGLVADGSDPGMKGVTRYVRLPEGVNTKAKYGSKGFEHILSSWHPDRQYTLEQIADAYGLRTELDAAYDDLGAGGAPMVDPGSDWVVGVLQKNGLIISEDKTKGLWHCECPFISEHTGRDNTGTAYLGAGMWSCHHGHCIDRDHDEFTKRLMQKFPTDVDEAVHDAAVNDFGGDGDFGDAGLAPSNKAKDDFDAIADAFGEDYAKDFQETKELGPFQSEMKQAGFSFADALAMGPQTNHAWLMKHIMPREGLGDMYGPTGTGKTFIAIDMTCRFVYDMPWHGNKWKADGAALYIMSEGGKDMAVNRFVGWAKKHNITTPTNRLQVQNVSMVLGASQEAKDYETNMIRWVRWWLKSEGLTSLDILVVDTLNMNMEGDENQTHDMTAVVQAAKRLSRVFGCFVLVIHHTGKDVSKGARGNNSLKNALEAEFRLDAETGDTRGNIVIDKNRNGPTGGVYGYELEQVYLTDDEDGDAVNTLVVKEVAPRVARTTLNQTDRAIMDAFKDVAGTGTVEGRVKLDDLTKRASDVAKEGGSTYAPSYYKRKLRDGLVKRGVLRIDTTMDQDGKEVDWISVDLDEFSKIEVDQ